MKWYSIIRKRDDVNMRGKTLKRLIIVALIASVLIFSGCVEEESEIQENKSEMIKQAKTGDTVQVHYTGTLDDGTVFDRSIDRGVPLEFTIGSGQMIPGFDQAVNGMILGESKTVKIPADQAYGPYYEDLVQVVNRSDLPEDVEVGQRLQGIQADGQIIVFTIINVSESNVTLDANHHLAGKDLTFEIKLVNIV